MWSSLRRIKGRLWPVIKEGTKIHSRERLCSSAELDDVAAVAFGRASGGQLFKLLEGFALGGDFLAEFAAGFGFAVESLRDGGWAADFTEQQDFDLEIAAVVGDAQHVSYANFARGLGGLAVGVNAA